LLEVDSILNFTGFTKGGHVLDTQGFIAHDEDSIILSYRCSTSLYDWLTNFNATTSEWEIEEDLALGYSGCLSGFEGLCCGISCGEGEGQGTKPRVHTGFYNNFLASLPTVKEVLEPMLRDAESPKTLFIVGHSLGAGLATLASIYFSMEFDWSECKNDKHRVVSVVVGSPRACGMAMAQNVNQALVEQRDRITLCRVVRDKDFVVQMPPRAFNYRHVGQLIYITGDEKVLINDQDKNIAEEVNETKTTRDLREITTLLKKNRFTRDKTEPKENGDLKKSNSGLQQAINDHMPDYYLRPLVAKFEGGTKGFMGMFGKKA